MRRLSLHATGYLRMLTDKQEGCLVDIVQGNAVSTVISPGGDE